MEAGNGRILDFVRSEVEGEVKVQSEGGYDHPSELPSPDNGSSLNLSQKSDDDLQRSETSMARAKKPSAPASREGSVGSELSSHRDPAPSEHTPPEFVTSELKSSLGRASSSQSGVMPSEITLPESTPSVLENVVEKDSSTHLDLSHSETGRGRMLTYNHWLPNVFAQSRPTTRFKSDPGPEFVTLY